MSRRRPRSPTPPPEADSPWNRLESDLFWIKGRDCFRTEAAQTIYEAAKEKRELQELEQQRAQLIALQRSILILTHALNLSARIKRIKGKLEQRSRSREVHYSRSREGE